MRVDYTTGSGVSNSSQMKGARLFHLLRLNKMLLCVICTAANPQVQQREGQGQGYAGGRLHRHLAASALAERGTGVNISGGEGVGVIGRFGPLSMSPSECVWICVGGNPMQNYCCFRPGSMEDLIPLLSHYRQGLCPPPLQKGYPPTKLYVWSADSPAHSPCPHSHLGNPA